MILQILKPSIHSNYPTTGSNVTPINFGAIEVCVLIIDTEDRSIHAPVATYGPVLKSERTVSTIEGKAFMIRTSR